MGHSLAQSTVLDMFESSVLRDPGAPALFYFGRVMSRTELDQLAEQIAYVLSESGISQGDRVILSLQNSPTMCAALLACWKIGVIAIPVNPMVRAMELGHIVNDSRAGVIIAESSLADVIEEVVSSAGTELEVFWSIPSDFAGDGPIPFAEHSQRSPSVGRSLVDVLNLMQTVDVSNHPADHARNELAVICYTSGTTGPPKGAMIRHANLSYEATTMAFCYQLAEYEPAISLPPIFHVTGLGQVLVVCLGNGLPLVLTYRFEPITVLRLIEKHRPVFTIAAITAYVALSGTEGATRANLGTMRTLYSGGAAVPFGVVEAFEQRFGTYIHNAYGLTESASACIIVPLGQRAPVDPTSGALSIGKAMPSNIISVVDDDGNLVPNGVVGELVIEGPGVCAGYWDKEAETANAFRPDGLHTGDAGFIDDDGWIYIVDRKKDLIVVSGYKVWPREVEDALYLHPCIREVAVVGIPDEYRGETAIAFVVTHEGQTVLPEELRAFCRDMLSAYKCPSEFHFLDTLPKTASGKVLRRELAAERLSSA